MGDVSVHILRKVAQVSQSQASPGALLEGVGLPREADTSAEARRLVSSEIYYELLERCHAGADHALPFRYGEAIAPDDFGAFGLALKTAPTVGEALERLVRFVLVISDTLTYSLADEGDGRRFELHGRPFEQRPGVRVANECALAAVVSVLRQVADGPVAPTAVSFRHPKPEDDSPHLEFFGCPVEFRCAIDALHFGELELNAPLRLGDEGLSAFLLAQLEEQRQKREGSSLVLRVRGAITDLLCEGAPRKAAVARKLGMSERTLQRHLADEGESFQGVVGQVRREVAESLLTTTQQSLGEVAFLTGFSDQSAFQRAFKGWTGQTPLGFRQAAP